MSNKLKIISSIEILLISLFGQLTFSLGHENIMMSSQLIESGEFIAHPLITPEEFEIVKYSSYNFEINDSTSSIDFLVVNTEGYNQFLQNNNSNDIDSINIILTRTDDKAKGMSVYFDYPDSYTLLAINNSPKDLMISYYFAIFTSFYNIDITISWIVTSVLIMIGILIGYLIGRKREKKKSTIEREKKN